MLPIPTEASGENADKASAEKVASTSQAITAISYTFNVTLPGGSSIVDSTVGSASTVSIASGANVLGPTAGVGAIEIQPQGTAKALTIGGNVKLDDRSVVNRLPLAVGTGA